MFHCNIGHGIVDRVPVLFHSKRQCLGFVESSGSEAPKKILGDWVQLLPPVACMRLIPRCHLVQEQKCVMLCEINLRLGGVT